MPNTTFRGSGEQFHSKAERFSPLASNAATCVSFTATEAPASSSWLDVPGTAVPARIQSFYYRWIRRRGTSTVHAEVIFIFDRSS